MKILQHILLIDDNEEDNEFHEIVIKAAGITGRVTSITEAEEAVEFFKKSLQNNTGETTFPELIFLDMMMPRIDGFQLLNILKHLLDENKQFSQRPKIFMLSGAYNPQMESVLNDSDYNSLILGYRIKPLTKQMLAQIMEKYFPEVNRV